MFKDPTDHTSVNHMWKLFNGSAVEFDMIYSIQVTELFCILLELWKYNLLINGDLETKLQRCNTFSNR